MLTPFEKLLNNPEIVGSNLPFEADIQKDKVILTARTPYDLESFMFEAGFLVATLKNTYYPNLTFGFTENALILRGLTK